MAFTDGRLFAALVQRGMKQKDLAETSGVPAQYVSEAIRGTRRLRLEHRQAIAKALHCREEDLFDMSDIIEWKKKGDAQ